MRVNYLLMPHGSNDLCMPGPRKNTFRVYRRRHFTLHLRQDSDMENIQGSEAFGYEKKIIHTKQNSYVIDNREIVESCWHTFLANYVVVSTVV